MRRLTQQLPQVKGVKKGIIKVRERSVEEDPGPPPSHLYHQESPEYEGGERIADRSSQDLQWGVYPGGAQEYSSNYNEHLDSDLNFRTAADILKFKHVL